MGLWSHIDTGVCKRLRTDAGVAVASHDLPVPGKWGVDVCQRFSTGNFRQKVGGRCGDREGRKCDQAEAMEGQEGREAV